MVEKEIQERAKILLERSIEQQLIDSLDGPEIIVLTGSRQVGKTSLCFRLIEYLLNKKKVSPFQIVYIDLEFPTILSQVNTLYGKDFLAYLSSQNVDIAQRSFVFIDEVHYLENPSSFLKVLHDHFPSLKLIVSGSSSLEIKRKFRETLTGRKKVFEVNPLDFEEFLLFKNSNLRERKKYLSLREVISNDSLPDLSEIKFIFHDFRIFFEEYLTFGGYPAVVLKDNPEKKKSALFEIYSSYVRRDIKDFAVISNIMAFNRLVELLANQIGGLISISELTTTLGISRPTLENYLFLLEQTFIITLLKPFFTNRRQEIIKSPKVFFNDTGLRNAILRSFDPVQGRMDKGLVFENAVFTEFKKKLMPMEEIHFWRSKAGAEVDFVLQEKELLPVEVKFGLSGSRVPSGERSFIRRYHPHYAIVVNNDIFSQEKLGSTKVFFLPPWAL